MDDKHVENLKELLSMVGRYNLIRDYCIYNGKRDWLNKQKKELACKLEEPNCFGYDYSININLLELRFINDFEEEAKSVIGFLYDDLFKID